MVMQSSGFYAIYLHLTSSGQTPDLVTFSWASGTLVWNGLLDSLGNIKTVIKVKLHERGTTKKNVFLV